MHVREERNMLARGRPIIAAMLFIAIVVAVACIGGGWIALYRVDPLLAVPGMALAGYAAAWLARGTRVLRFVGSCAAGCAVGLAIAALTLAGWLPWREWVLAIAASVVAAFLGGAMVRWSRALWQRGLPGRIGAVGVAILLVLLWQRLSWAMLASLYTPQPVINSPHVLMVSALPLRTGDPDRALSQGLGSAPILAEWPASADITLADSVAYLRAGGAAGKVDVLFLAHPHALPPADLVLVDDWVRGGGKVLILADGLLSWSMPYPLGDARNPPVTSLLTPLLSHWGLRLDAPAGLAERETVVNDRGSRLALFSAGRFISTGPACSVSQGGAIADCRIGKGRALLVADADLLRPEQWQGGKAGPLGWRAGNPHWIADAVASLAGQPIEHRGAAPLWWR